ncbi:MAG: serine/threonine-protein kinase [Planctomycetota bacterium]
MDDLTGQRLGDYQLLRLLGRGAMASVYLAEQRSLARRVAVKVLSVELGRDPASVDRFRHEARAAASLVHPNIVQVHEVGSAEAGGVERHFLAQEYVAGGTLGRLVARDGALPPGGVLAVLTQVGSALALAAERGLVHRDIKPDNLMLDRSGAVKVADFGLARLAEGDGPRMTQAGVALGTPLYMSPEQIEGRDVDSRSDLYSLGVTAFQLLSGEPPFTGDTPLSVAVQHLNTPPPSVADRAPSAPAVLVTVVDRMLTKEPAARPEDPHALLAELSAVASVAEAEGWAGERGAVARGDTTGLPGGTLRTPADAATVARLSRAMKAEAKPRRGRRVALMGVAGLLLGVAGGLATRPSPVLDRWPDRVGSYPTVKEQLYHAKRIDTPAAWEAVRREHPDADVFYQRLALRGAGIAAVRSDQPRRAARCFEELARLAGDEPPTVIAAAAEYVALASIGRGDGDDAATARASVESADRAAREAAESDAPGVMRRYREAIAAAD